MVMTIIETKENQNYTGIMQGLNALITNISAFKSCIMPFLKFKVLVNFDFFFLSEASIFSLIWSAPTISFSNVHTRLLYIVLWISK